MTKRQRRFEQNADFRQQFRQLSTDTIRRRPTTGMLQPEAAIALREVLAERQQSSDTGAIREATTGVSSTGVGRECAIGDRH
jgi:hypothetical protein